MGVYVGALGAGAALAAGLTLPLADVFDGQWNLALACGRSRPRSRVGGAVVRRAPATRDVRRGGIDAALLRDRLAWQVTRFFGSQSLLFYAGLAWLPIDPRRRLLGVGGRDGARALRAARDPAVARRAAARGAHA